jgi:hypothetical protein
VRGVAPVWQLEPVACAHLPGSASPEPSALLPLLASPVPTTRAHLPGSVPPQPAATAGLASNTILTVALS